MALNEGYLKDELEGSVPEETAQEIIKDVARGSAVLRLAKTVDMKGEKKKVPVMTDGVGAYWVGEGQRIQTSKPTWIFPELTAKKLAVIIPTTKEKLEDSTFDVFAELKEAIAEAFHVAIDAAAMFGTDSPFATNILQSAINSGNLIVRGTNESLDLDVSDVMGLVEEASTDVNGFAAHYGIKNDLRKLRDKNGNALFVPDTNQNELYSNPIDFARNGAWDRSKAEIIAGDWNKLLIGIRDGIEYEILKEATLQGTLAEDGKPISLAEQDLIAIKATMRIGLLVVKDDAFAVLQPKREDEE
ncbi:MAG: phage major capsid protein [Lachnospiraceae bacterium]|nr:phage major capsid protein [Lachnospiraceae bacterium]